MMFNLLKKSPFTGLILVAAVISFAFHLANPETDRVFNKSIATKQGLDLKGGVSLTYALELENTPADEHDSAVRSTIEVIQRRVDITGTAEPSIRAGRVGADRVVIVELAGLTDIEEAIKLIGQTAQLEFKEQAQSEDEWIPTGLTGRQLRRASVAFNQTTNQPEVGLEFNNEGANLFAEITGRNVGRPLAIFLDDELLQSPIVQQKITGNQAVISGQFNIKEVRQIVSLLNAGALDVPLKLIEQRVIGATLGEDSVKKSLVAGMFGLAAIAIYMIFTYGFAGLLVSLALVSYVVITFAVFRFIPVTLTLAGIAGFILSVGMAIDANILILERFREELKQGNELKIAAASAFRRSFTAIKDSNIATIITCIILYFTTSGMVRGFALTLAIGVLISLFSSITISRQLVKAALATPGLNKLVAKF